MNREKLYHSLRPLLCSFNVTEVLILLGLPSPGIKALAQKLGLKKNTVHATLYRLEAMEYVQRKPLPRTEKGSRNHWGISAKAGEVVQNLLRKSKGMPSSVELYHLLRAVVSLLNITEIVIMLSLPAKGIKPLAKKLGLMENTVNLAILRLEKKGYVKRISLPKMEERSWLSWDLTPEGETLWADLIRNAQGKKVIKQGDGVSHLPTARKRKRLLAHGQA